MRRYALIGVITCAVGLLQLIKNYLDLHVEDEELELLWRSEGTSHNQLSLGVCITGQFCRLEIENKFREFLGPSSRVYDVNIVFILADGPCQFVNSRTDVVTMTKEMILSEGEKYNIGSNNIQFVSKPSMPDFYQERYVQSLDKIEANSTARALGHLHQWGSLAACLDHLKPSDLYVRIRDDSIFFDEFVPLASTLSTYDIGVPGCLSHGGFNDRGAIVRPEVALLYFKGLQQAYMYLYNIPAPSRGLLLGFMDLYDIPVPTKSYETFYFNAHNSESFFASVMRLYGVSVKRLSAAKFPTVNAVSLGNDSVCFKTPAPHLISCIPASSTSKLSIQGRSGLNCADARPEE